MKKVTAILCSAVAVLALTSAAFGQGQGRGQGRGFGGGFGGGGLFMLMTPEVQQELKMTQPQIEKVQPKMQETMAAMQGVDFQNMSQEERQAFGVKMQTAQSKAVTDILDFTQMKRYNQLALQQQLQMGGPAAYSRKEVADQIKLTDDQKKKITAIGEELQKQRQDARQGFDFQNATPEERQKFMSKNQELSKAAGDKVEAILTEDQKKSLKEMTGAPFKFPAFAGGRRRQP